MRRGLAAGLLLVVMTLAAYLPATRCGYIWDDEDYVQNNQTLRSADGLRRIWFDLGATRQYYPMVHTSYWLEYRVWKLKPAGYHVVNILLHAAAAVLLWRVLRVLRVPGAWVAAAVFAVHPVHVESVAWITERKNVLSGVFYLGATLAYLHYALAGGGQARPRGRATLYVASLVLYVFALLSKSVTCTLPAALLLVVWWKRGRLGWKDVRGLAPHFVLGIALGLLTVVMEKYKVGAAGEAWDLSFVERCLIAGRVVCFYAGKLLWPAQLTFIYPRWQIDAYAWWQYLFPAAVALTVGGLWLAARRLGRGPLVAVLFFIGTLFPALGFFDVFPMQFSFVADHFQYLASIGLIALVVGGTWAAANRFGPRAGLPAALVAAAVLGVLGALTWQQTHVYKNLEMLWRDTLRKNPDAWIAHNNLGTLLRDEGRVEEAIEHFRQALRSRPDYVKAQYNLGAALTSQGRHDEAITHLRRAVALKPDLAAAHVQIGNALTSQDRYEEAIAHYRQALQIKPRLASAHSFLAVALTNAGRVTEGLEEFRQAISLDPDQLASLNQIAWILGTHPAGSAVERKRSVRLAELAVQLTGRQDAAALDALAAAYAATGRFEEAVATAETALAVATAGNHELADGVRRRLTLYRNGEPYRQRTGRGGMPSD